MSKTYISKEEYWIRKKIQAGQSQEDLIRSDFQVTAMFAAITAMPTILLRALTKTFFMRTKARVK